MRPRTLIASTLAAVTLAVLVPSLATAFFCGGHGVCLDPIDVVVNVTAGANDPVSGATVVARDDRTGRVVSSTTTTGDLGYTVIRLRPGASAQRITITATGGRSQVVGGLSGADVMSATAQRGAIAAEIDVNVNPGSTVLAEYLNVRPGASIAAAERAVARRLRLPAGTDVAESARFARSRFSGADFITAARERGGVQAYADWTADRIGNGAGVRSFAAPRPVDDLPLRGDALGASRGASPRRENNVAASIAITVLKPFIEAGAQKIFCGLGIKFLCRSTPTPTPASGLTAAEKKQLADIERGISDLATQMTTAQQTLSAIEVQVAALGGQVAALNYGPEMNAVQDIIEATRAAAGLRAEGRDVPAGLAEVLTNALARRYEINSGCPNWAALVGALPTAAVMDGSELRHPRAACASLAQGIGISNGLMQFAQRKVAAASSIVTAGPTQAKVDLAGEFWLGEFAKNVVSSNMASEYALRPGGNSTRTAEVVDATTQLFNDALGMIEIDATGAYFGARILNDQILVMGPASGTLYGIGYYQMDPGTGPWGLDKRVQCRGNTPWQMNWSRLPGAFRPGLVGYAPSATPAGVATASEPVAGTPAACSPGQFVSTPPEIPGAPPNAWESPDALPAENLPGVLAALRRAALCHMKDRVNSGVTFRPEEGTSVGGLCDSYPAPIPDEPVLAWEGSQVLKEPAGHGVMPNLQLSLKDTGCVPWTIGFTTHARWVDGHRTSPKGENLGITEPTSESLPASATGMQCRVVDLTPAAADRYGSNCVSANPAGKILYQGYRGATVTVPVTSSLRELNTRVMGGYCPNLGGIPAPPGSANVAYFTGEKIICSPPLATYSRKSVEKLGTRLTWRFNPLTNREDPVWVDILREHSDSPCVGSRDYRSPNTAFDFPLVWPLQRQIRALTTYNSVKDGESTQQAGVPGYQAANWTYNNQVAGDYVVGPLYSSRAVGAYVPGTSPGGPAADAPPRVAGARVPDAVLDLSVCAEDCTGDATSLRVEWRPPVSSGGLAIRRYEVSGTTMGNFPRSTRSCTTSSASVLQCTFRNLDLSEEWEFRVWATNALGRAQGAVAVRFISGPGRPALRALKEALEVRWTTPRWKEWYSSAGVSIPHNYTAMASPGGRTCTAAGFSTTTCTITGLTPGTAYTVTVVLRSEYNCYAKMPCGRDDTSPPSAAVAPLGVPVRPGAPDLEAAEPSEGRIAVKWRVPAFDGDSPIAGYTATASPGGATCTTTGTLACTIDGLSPGAEYFVTVTATNAVGTGLPSERLTRTTPLLVPAPPRTPLAQASVGSIEVGWVAPDFDGGTAISGYTATASPGGAQCSTDGATTCTISGLPHGTDYEVTITATNAVGTGRASVPATARTPTITAPGAPRPPELTALPGRIEVGWSAPESDGGSAVTGYVATATPGGATCSTTGATLCTITGLEDGTAYRVAVAAVNVIGTGPSAEASAPVTPRRHADGVPRQADEFELEPVAVPGTAEPVAPAGGPEASEPVAPGGAPGSGPALVLADVALTPRTLVPGLGGRIAYSLSEPADVTITFARVGTRDRQSRVVHRIPAGRPGALAGDTRIRVIYSRTSPRRKVAGAWTMTIEARDAQGRVARRIIPIRVRS